MVRHVLLWKKKDQNELERVLQTMGTLSIQTKNAIRTNLPAVYSNVSSIVQCGPDDAGCTRVVMFLGQDEDQEHNERSRK
jgi:hypothetical protein